MPAKNEILRAELKEFLHSEFERLNGIHNFTSNNQFYIKIVELYPFVSQSTVRRAYLHSDDTLSELPPDKTNQLNFNYK